MSDRRRLLLCEGDDDRAVLQALQAIGLVPTGFDVKQCGGKDRLLDQAAAHLRAGLGLVALLDLDDLDEPALSRWFESGLQSRLLGEGFPSGAPPGSLARRSTSERPGLLELTGPNGPARTTAIAAGLPHDAALRTRYRITRFAIDDFLLRVVEDEAVYGAVSELGEVPHALAFHKIDEFLDLMVKNGLVLTNAKRVLHLLRGITGFRASPATFAARVIASAAQARGVEWLRAWFAPLIESLQRAEAELG